MRITEPYNGTDKDKNYVKEYLYILLKNSNEINHLLLKVYPSCSSIKKVIKDDVDIMLSKYISEFREYIFNISKYNMITDIKDRLLQRYTNIYFENIRMDLNRNIRI